MPEEHFSPLNPARRSTGAKDQAMGQLPLSGTQAGTMCPEEQVDDNSQRAMCLVARV